MATKNYTINYEDEKFKNVEAEKQTALNEMNNTYNEMISQSDKFYEDQINATKDYASQQQQLQQENTDFTISKIEQDKAQAEKDYTKEQSGAYVDWQKQSNQYGANAEQMAANGLQGSGYSESSQVSMYNSYQNRVAIARESFNKAVLNYDNSIKEAQLQNNVALAEISYNALKTQLELSLQGFQYKNSLLLEQMNKKQEIDNTYYARYQDVLNQMNQENAMAEQIRQYNESLAEQKRQYNQSYQLQLKEYEEGIRQFNAQMTMQEKQYKEDIRQFDEQIKYYREKDAQEYALKIKQLEEEKRQYEKDYKLKQEQLRQAEIQFEKEYALKQEQAAQSQKQWEKEYALAVSKAKASSSGSSGGTINKSSSSGSSTVAKSSSSSSTKTTSTQTYNQVLNGARALYYSTKLSNPSKAAATVDTYLAQAMANGKIGRADAEKILTNLLGSGGGGSGSSGSGSGGGFR